MCFNKELQLIQTVSTEYIIRKKGSIICLCYNCSFFSNFKASCNIKISFYGVVIDKVKVFPSPVYG